MNIFGASGLIKVNGKHYAGSSISINNGVVKVDGVTQDEKILDQIVNVTIDGNVGSVQTMSGDVKCLDVSGDIETMSGDVTCGKINGKVETMSGDIITKP